MLVHAGVCGLENPSVHETVCVNAVSLFWAWANTSMPQWQFRNLTDLTEIHNWSSYGAGAPASGEHCQPACGGQGCHGIFCNSFSWGNWGNRLGRLSRLTRRNERRRDIDIKWIEMFTHKKNNMTHLDIQNFWFNCLFVACGLFGCPLCQETGKTQAQWEHILYFFDIV